MHGIFVSYRRSDSPDATGRIYERLASEFGNRSFTHETQHEFARLGAPDQKAATTR